MIARPNYYECLSMLARLFIRRNLSDAHSDVKHGSSNFLLAYPVVTIFDCLFILSAICIAQMVIDLRQHPYHRRRCRVLK